MYTIMNDSPEPTHTQRHKDEFTLAAYFTLLLLQHTHKTQIPHNSCVSGVHGIRCQYVWLKLCHVVISRNEASWIGIYLFSIEKQSVWLSIDGNGTREWAERISQSNSSPLCITSDKDSSSMACINVLEQKDTNNINIARIDAFYTCIKTRKKWQLIVCTREPCLSSRKPIKIKTCEGVRLP